MNRWTKLFAAALLAVAAALTGRAQNLRPAGIAVSPSSALPGDQVTATVTVNNSGTSFSGTASFRLTFTHRKTGFTFSYETPVPVSPKGGLIGAATTDPTTGQQTPGVGSFEISFNLPTKTLQAGEYSATVIIDPLLSGPSFTKSDPVLTVTGKPDFQILSLTYQSGISRVGGDVLPMSITYTNRSVTGGTYNVPFILSTNKGSKPVRVQVVLSSNPVYGDADDFMLTFFDIDGDLDADDAVHTRSWNQLLPGNFSGSYYVLAKIDALEVIDETGEAEAKPKETNVWLDVSGSRVGLQPTSFPSSYVATMAAGATAGGYSDNPKMSDDGRYTVYVSDAANLVTGDTNSVRDVFIYDNQTSVVRRLSVSEQGREANGASNNPSISGDGRYVAFASDATTMMFGDTNGFTDIFVVDSIAGRVTRESVSTKGDQSNGPSFKPSLSRDGRYLVFESNATNLTPTTTSGAYTQIYLRDRTTGQTTLVSQGPDGSAGNRASMQAVVSADGKFVAFASDSDNLVGGDTNALRDVFIREVATGAVTRVSVATGGAQATGGASRAPSISQDGRYVAYSSDATNLVADDTNGITDVFVFDRLTGGTTRVSVSSSGAQAVDATNPAVTGSAMGSFSPSISATGRYVAFASLAGNLGVGDAVGEYDPNGSANRALNVYVMDRDVTATGTLDSSGNIKVTNVSVNRFGFQAYYILNVQSTAAADITPSISGDGRWVTYPTDAEGAPGLIHGATNLISPDANNARDVIVFDRKINALPNDPVVPTVEMTSPSNGSRYPVNTPIDVIARASAPIGSVASVQFFVNGKSLGAAMTAFPYVTTWTPTGTGEYSLSAMVTDSFGNQGVSQSVKVIVELGAAPQVSITSPTNNSTVTVGKSLTITADAKSPNGVIKSVQFFANGAAVGAPITVGPYSVSWAPAAAGPYVITAKAVDNGGAGTSSSAVTVMATPNAVSADRMFSGTYLGTGENGSIAFIQTGSTLGTLIAYSGSTPARRYLFPSVTISPGGSFSGKTADGVTVTGTISATGIMGSIDGTRLTFIAPLAQASSSSSSFVGYYRGSLEGNSGSDFTGIVAPDGAITLFLSGSFIDAGSGTVDSVGNFAVETSAGNRITGVIDPASNFLRASIAGTNPGTIIAANATGAPFSDGVLRNLSTRGSVTGGDSILIAGFYVNGDTPKQVLVRGVGPALRPYGVTTPLVDPQIKVVRNVTNGTVSIGDNNNWDNSTTVRDASAAVGAFPLDPASRDAVLLLTLNPGSYSVHVSAADGGTGVALVEVYDVDNASPFTAQKVVNLSTRGLVGTDQSQLIAGFAVSGTMPKKVLIRGVGPSLANVGMKDGLLSDPVLRLSRLVNGVDTVVRENDNWSQGNDAGLVAEASTKVGAFALTADSKDAVILITLPPGGYTAQLTGAKGSTGIGLIEVYEVP